MELLSEGTRRALSRWDGRPRQLLALLCAAAAVVALLGSGGAESGDAARAPVDHPAADLAAGSLTAGYVAAVLPAGPAALAIAPGDRVDVYAAVDGAAGLIDGGSPKPAADLIASDARILSIAPLSPDRAGAGEPAGYVVVELPDAAARDLAARAGARLTLVVRARDGTGTND